MAEVIFDTNVGDSHALYVWPSEFVISWGTWGGFAEVQQSLRHPNTFSDADWSQAIGKAVAAAEEWGFPTVIVMRGPNAPA